MALAVPDVRLWPQGTAPPLHIPSHPGWACDFFNQGRAWKGGCGSCGLSLRPGQFALEQVGALSSQGTGLTTLLRPRGGQTCGLQQSKAQPSQCLIDLPTHGGPPARAAEGQLRRAQLRLRKGAGERHLTTKAQSAQKPV